MLDALIGFSLRNRFLVLVTAALLLVWGGFTLMRLPVDVFPDLNRPTVTVMTEAHGLAPEEVETLVTARIESALNGAPGIERVRSVSSVGLSVVYAEFAWSEDVYRARQSVTERLQTARELLPAGVSPTMAPVSSLMGEILLIGLQADASASGPGTSPRDLRTFADFTLRPRLLAIPGVSQVTPIGGEVKQIEVTIDPLKLQSTGITLDQVIDATASAQANTTGGVMESQGQEQLIRNIARTASVEELGATAVASRGGIPLRLADLGAVSETSRVKRGDASMKAAPAVILAVSKQPGASTIKLTEQIEAQLEQVRATLPLGTHVKLLFRQASFIESAVANVEHALRDGSILVALVLLLFLANLRTTAITLTAIPLSIVVAGLVFHAFGLSINTMTLGGLAIAVGELVDDAIVDVENVFRRLQQELRSEKPRPVLAIVQAASSEVRGSIVFATILVVLVFAPLFALSGIEGRLFAPLGIAYIVSILASLIVSLTVTPVLCSFLLPRSKAMRSERYGSRLVGWLRAWDARLVAWTLPRAGRIIAATAILVVTSIITVAFFGREFLPPFNEGTATVNVLAAPGTSLEESNRIGSAAELLLLSVPEVVTTGRRTGRAELDEHAEGVHYSEIDVDFAPSERSREVILSDMRQRLAELPGAWTSIGQPISHRLDHLLSGVRAQVAVKLFGPDADVLRAKAREIQAVMSGVPGVVDLSVEPQVLVPQVIVKIRRDAAARVGLPPGELAEVAETALAGRVVGQVLDGQKVHDLVVRYGSSERSSIEALRATLIGIPSGGVVALGDVADIFESEGPNQVSRENGQRRIVISCNVSGRDLVRTVEDLRSRVTQQVALPSSDYFIQLGGQFESQRSASRLMALLSLVSLAGMVAVLWSHFRSMAFVLQVLVNIPLALIGAVAAVALSGGVFSIASLVGFITLTGIASRNTIMMISHYAHLVLHEGERVNEAMVIRGSTERLAPVLMTALTAGLSLIPLTLAAGEAGKEILFPVAVVVLGGLVSSTLLDIVLTPAVFWRFGRGALERMAAERAASSTPSEIS